MCFSSNRRLYLFSFSARYGTASLQNAATQSVINCPQCEEAFESLLDDYNVDFYIAGHVHWYERLCPKGIKKEFKYKHLIIVSLISNIKDLTVQITHMFI